VDVLHNTMAFDPTRRLLYAYVSPGDSSHPKSFAIIDVDRQTVRYSTQVDFVPWRLRVSPDGSYLYVATANSGEVVRLALPDLTIDMRFELGPDQTVPPFVSTYNQKFDAGDIVISPQDSKQFIVSLLHLDYYTCAIGLRIYNDATKLAELYHLDINAPSLGDALTIDQAGRLVTVCTGQYPDTVTRLSIGGNSLSILDTQNGIFGLASSVDVSDTTILTGAGNKFDMPQFTLRGGLPPLTLFNQGDPAPLLYGCTFADEVGAVAACISHTDGVDGFPTFRSFVLYELTNANSFGYIPLDLGVNNHASKIIRLGSGQFAVSVGPNYDNPFFISTFHYLQQNTRIYFLTGINTTYP
jgi:DNA-binding beta-propeller fold protein YncE